MKYDREWQNMRYGSWKRTFWRIITEHTPLANGARYYADAGERIGGGPGGYYR